MLGKHNLLPPIDEIFHCTSNQVKYNSYYNYCHYLYLHSLTLEIRFPFLKKTFSFSSYTATDSLTIPFLLHSLITTTHDSLGILLFHIISTTFLISKTDPMNNCTQNNHEHTNNNHICCSIICYLMFSFSSWFFFYHTNHLIFFSKYQSGQYF